MANNPTTGQYLAVAKWDIPNHPSFASGDLDAGSYTPNSGAVIIPEGALITRAYYMVEATFIDADDTDNGTLALGYTGATGAFVAAITAAASGDVWDAGARGTLVGHGGVETGDDNQTAIVNAAKNAASFIHLTADKSLLLTIATDTFDTGVLTLYVEYVMTGQIA